jgi:EAL domain-containing protein (putative c-di-GMP-specific phosphodiesterase class I)
MKRGVNPTAYQTSVVVSNFYHGSITAHNLMKPATPSGSSVLTKMPRRRRTVRLIEYIEVLCRWKHGSDRCLPTSRLVPLTKPKTALMYSQLSRPLEEQLKSDLKMNLEKTYKNKAFIDAIQGEGSS